MHTIIPEVPKPSCKDDSVSWPEISYFGIFDGKNGTGCAKYVKNNLHDYVIYLKLNERYLEIRFSQMIQRKQF